MDVISASTFGGEISWHEQLVAAAGDANRDSWFDLEDILQVLQTGKYLTGKPATWDEGDWNGDGVFDQLDIVAALRTGTYVRGNTPLDDVFARMAG
jgi:hypothetical protein